jgi:hypothetical protein
VVLPAPSPGDDARFFFLHLIYAFLSEQPVTGGEMMRASVTVVRRFEVLDPSPELLQLLEEHASDLPLQAISCPLDGEEGRQLAEGLARLAAHGDEGARVILQAARENGAINCVLIYS